MKKKCLTEPQKQQIILRYEAGESSVSIAKSLGCSKTFVLRLLRQAGIKRRSNSEAQGGVGSAQELLVCSRYLEGITSKEVGKEFGLSGTTVLAILERYDIPRRSPKQTSLKLSEQQIEQIVSLYEDGVSLTDITKEVGCGQWSAWHQLKLAGVEIRGARGGDTLK